MKDKIRRKAGEKKIRLNCIVNKPDGLGLKRVFLTSLPKKLFLLFFFSVFDLKRKHIRKNKKKIQDHRVTMR